ncbi:vancomycin high temperature exclusion protein [Actinomadura sp. 9N407]|uniref:vancomycin high temperature exclusion protein n=1 Tax=Actinomadura sp. 9N407 TaxID=3375154 RepID=UPI00378FF91F
MGRWVFVRLRRRWVVRLLLAGILLVVAALVPIGWAYLSSAPYRESVQDVPAAPVALVLGAGVRPDGSASLSLSQRLDLAAGLYRSGKVEVLLVSGDNRTKNYDEPSVMRDYLLRHGVPARRIVRDYAGHDTWDSCTRAKRVFGVNRLTVVTQSFHLPRAVVLCRAAGIETNGVGSNVWIKHATTLGYAREPIAMLKAMTDVVSRPDPEVLGRPETSVREALSSPR